MIDAPTTESGPGQTMYHTQFSRLLYLVGPLPSLSVRMVPFPLENVSSLSYAEQELSGVGVLTGGGGGGTHVKLMIA